jgi:rhodanese-related sulfurtransferase/predicted ester cyclase
MSSRSQSPGKTVDVLLDEARRGLTRLSPEEAHAAVTSGAQLVDIRSELQRSRDGVVPGAAFVARNVLEWRLDPRSPHRDPALASRDTTVILTCNEGYQSSLAAATLRELGVDATDVVGGFQAWRAAGLPVEHPPRAADTTTDEVASIARRALEQVCSRGDFTQAEELYSEDFRDHVNGLTFHGLAGVKESVGLYRSVFPDLEIRVDDQVVDGDRVTSRWTAHGTHRGRRASTSGITISRIAGGKIVEDWTVSDTAGLLRQLGVRRVAMLGLRQLVSRVAAGRR